ncbi:DNA adenine methylase, partial [Helicobacter ganmani]
MQISLNCISKICTLCPYAKMAKEIVERMPEHSCYCEVFAGSLSVLYAKERPFAKYNEVINDWNADLINL